MVSTRIVVLAVGIALLGVAPAVAHHDDSIYKTANGNGDCFDGSGYCQSAAY